MRPSIATALLVGGLLAASGCAGVRPPEGALQWGGFPYPLTEEPRAGLIVHLPTGLTVSFEQAMELISGARLVAIGETHDNIHAHEVELAVIRDLHRRHPGGIAIGMEMFREPQQETLDRWVRGDLTELEFLRAVKWYDTWGSDFSYYRGILEFARDNRIDVIALNPPKELQTAVSRMGLANLPESLKAKLPEIGEADFWQREVAKAIDGGHIPSEGMFDSFFRVQLLWEESMAQRVVDYLGSPAGQGKRMVTITGGWHAQYGFGVPKKVVRRLPMPYAVVIPEEINVPEDKRGQQMEITLPAIPLMKADVAWMVDYEGVEVKRVKLGVRITDASGTVVAGGEEGTRRAGVLVLGAEPGSPAAKAGLAKGDLIVALDGKEVTQVTDLLYHVSFRAAGDKGTVTVSRGGTERVLPVEWFAMPKPAVPGGMPRR